MEATAISEPTVFEYKLPLTTTKVAGFTVTEELKLKTERLSVLAVTNKTSVYKLDKEGRNVQGLQQENRHLTTQFEAFKEEA